MTMHEEPCGDHVPLPTSRENACLLAAAPDLLALCVEALGYHEDTSPDFHERLCAALAKARGEA